MPNPSEQTPAGAAAAQPGASSINRRGPSAFPLIPLTAEFMKMLGTSDEKAIYALKPVFATRCERLSSTNKFLERAVLFSQSGSLLVIDTSNGRVTHTLELGEQRNTDWNITVDADREKDSATQTQGVRITIDKAATREAFDNMSNASPPEELCLQFHCARAPVAVNFVAMARHFAAVKGPDGFQLRLSEHPLIQESRGRRGSIGDRLAAVRKSSFFSASPERSNSVAQIAKKKKREIEKRGEAIEVLPAAAVPSVRDQQRKEREDAVKRKREKEAADRILEERNQEEPAAARTAAAEAAAAPKPSSAEDYASDDDDNNNNNNTSAPAAAGADAANSLVHSDDEALVVVDDAYGHTTVAPPTPPTTTPPPSTPPTSSPPQGRNESEESLDEVAVGSMERGLGERRMPPADAGVPRASTPPQASALGDALRDAPLELQSNQADIDAPSTQLQPAVTTESSPGSGVRSILERMRAETAAAAKSRAERAATLLGDGADGQQGSATDGSVGGGAGEQDSLNPDDAEDEHPDVDEDAFIDGLSPKEAQEVVAGIMRSIEVLKEEQSRLMVERETAQKALRDLTSVTLRAEHALGLASIVWWVCDIKLVRHFNQR